MSRPTQSSTKEIATSSLKFTQPCALIACVGLRIDEVARLRRSEASTLTVQMFSRVAQRVCQ